MEGHELWHASIIHSSSAQLPAMKINPKWPPLRVGEELMFPQVRIRPRHWDVLRTFQGSRDLQAEDTVHTINPSDLGLLPCQKDPGYHAQKGQLLYAEVSLPQEAPWLNTVGDNKKAELTLLFPKRREKLPNLKQSLQQRHINRGS